MFLLYSIILLDLLTSQSRIQSYTVENAYWRVSFQIPWLHDGRGASMDHFTGMYVCRVSDTCLAEENGINIAFLKLFRSDYKCLLSFQLFTFAVGYTGKLFVFYSSS